MVEPNDKLTAAAGKTADTGRERKEIAQIERRAFQKAGILFAALLVLLLLTSLPQVRHFISGSLPSIKQFIQDCGPWAPVVFILIVAVLVGAGISRLAFHFVGGALFAFWGGMVWTCIGTLIGYTVVFLAVRQLGLRDSLLRKHPAWQKLAARLKHNTVPAVIIFRQLPLPGIVTNTVLALSPIRRREFFLGTIIGLIPEAVPTTLIGAGLRKEHLGATAAYLFGAVVLFIVVWIVWGIYTRRVAAREGMLDPTPDAG